MKDSIKSTSTINLAIDIFIRLGFLILLIAWCFRLLYPFAGIVLWGIILALALAPLFSILSKRLGNKPKLASFLLISIGLIFILFPSWLFFDSTIDGIKEFNTRLDGGTLTIPPPSKKVADWPLIGDELYDIWNQASTNLEGFIQKYYEQIEPVVKSLISGFVGMGISILQLVLALIIAGVLLSAKGTEDFSKKFFRRVIGAKGEEFTEVISKTVINVTKGVLGVAFIQALLVGIGFLFAGVPYAGVWTLIILILAILQLPPTIIILPIILYLYSANSVLFATIWTVYLLLAGASDNLLKPILLGKGAPVPMLVIFLGVIGGFMLSGFIGLFTGAIILSIGYKLFITWINLEESKTIDSGEKI